MGIHLAIPSASVRAVSSASPVAGVPGAAPIIIGVTSRRGRIVGVVDLAPLLDSQHKAQARPYTVWLYHGGLDLALGADSISGLQTVPTEKLLHVQGHGEVFVGVLEGVCNATLVDLDSLFETLGVSRAR
jgi:chemotaxis signal transduction protein